MDLIDSLVHDGWLKTPRIIEAFRKVSREDFVPEYQRVKANFNIPLSIGYNQTISQPLVTAFMIELLDPVGKILDIGSGSGWTTVILAHLADYVWGVDRIAELVEFAKKNSHSYACNNLEFVLTERDIGYLPAGKVDRILVSAAASCKKDIAPLFQQLEPEGIMVVPIKESLWKFEGDQATEYPGFVFVPLISSPFKD